jgi:ABC-type uncharacterized transport system substrate-binding protein
VLQRFAKHYQTGEPLPADLLKRFLAARKFNQGFATVEFVSSALIDLEFHTQPASASRDVRAFEQAELDKIGMPAEIVLRHRPTQFGHIFSGDNYASGYYSYMWPATSSIPPLRSVCMTTSIPPAARAIRRKRILPSADGSPSRMRCCAGAVFCKRPRQPEMRMTMHRLMALLALAGGLALAALPAQAHPHVWVTSASELVYSPDGSITGVRHAWTFDDMFTTYALQGIETKTKGVYTREELAPLAKDNVENLKEFGYFTFAKADGKKQKFEEPIDYFLEYKDSALTLHFTLPLKAPAKPKQLALDIFDPSFFIDFKFEDKDPVKLVGAPETCQLKVQRPGEADVKKLTEEMIASGDQSNYGAMYANKIAVTCP